MRAAITAPWPSSRMRPQPALGRASSSRSSGVADSGPRSLDELLWALEPRVAVVTAIRSDHGPAFGGRLDEAAREKAKAVAVLPGTGLAVLNADDQRGLAMESLARCRVVLAGRAEDADVRILDARLTPDARLVVRLEDRERAPACDAADRHPLGDGRRSCLRGGDEAWDRAPSCGSVRGRATSLVKGARSRDHLARVTMRASHDVRLSAGRLPQAHIVSGEPSPGTVAAVILGACPSR